MAMAQVGPFMRKTCQPLSRVLILAQHDIAIRFQFKGLFGYETGNRRSTLETDGVQDERHWWLPGPETSYHVGITQNSDIHGPSKLFISNLNPSIPIYLW